MVPAVTGVPSPQLIVARKSPTLPKASASVKVATSTCVSGAPSVPLTGTAVAVNAASATTSGPLMSSVAVPGASSRTVTLTPLVLSSRNVWVPFTANWPGIPVATTGPAVVVPSPQLIVAEKSAAELVG